MSKKPYKKPRLQTKESRIETSISSIENSFLNETSFNSDVDIEIRQEIEKKFKKSSVNSKYVFPRKDLTDTKRKKSPIKPRANIKPKLLMEKSLPTMHKITKSTHDSTGFLSKLMSMKKINKVTSSIKSLKDMKIKISKIGRNIPSMTYHNRASSQTAHRSKSPVLLRKETSLDPPKRHHRTISNKRKYYENTIARPRPVIKKSGHIYTSSMESVIPSAIIKSVSYY
ncbi:hypothetical protein SteCoe_12945 [Stentor coeruleus]|uniref:Uncharacterized protein n=1 Tax=Stentor coeruleus TaxID=5963 RepID=A0A1R2C9K0_9CILI|nr:hypothetical protein SteCoe_12945 [Stentor coeruleus]